MRDGRNARSFPDGLCRECLDDLECLVRDALGPVVNKALGPVVIKGRPYEGVEVRFGRKVSDRLAHIGFV